MNIQKNNPAIKEIKSIFEKQGKNIGDKQFDIFKCFNMKKLCTYYYAHKIVAISRNPLDEEYYAISRC